MLLMLTKECNMATPISKQVLTGNYDVDRKDQGYMKCNANANKGRLVSLVEVALSPIRFAGDMVCTAAIIAGLAIVNVISFAVFALSYTATCLTHFSKDSSTDKIARVIREISSFVFVNSFQNIFIALLSSSLNVVKVVPKTIGSLVGVVSPEIGRKSRVFSESKLVTELLVESIKEIPNEAETELKGPLQEIFTKDS